MNDKAKQLSTEKRKYIEGWLDGARVIVEIAPKVKEIYDTVKWEEDAIHSAPETLSDDLNSSLGGPLERSLENIQIALPPIPDFDPEVTIAGTASTVTASGSIVYGQIKRAEGIPDPAIQSWSKGWTQRYEALQESQSKHDEVRKLLLKLGPEQASEFDEAIESYRLATQGLKSRSDAANDMRNVLNHYKGELRAKATPRSIHPREHWPTIAKKLSVGGVDSVAYHEILAQEDRWKSLTKRLSDIVHENPSSSNLSLTALYTEFLDHLYIVLSGVQI